MRGLLVIALLVGCSDGGGSDTPVDAAPPDAYDTARCLIAGDYGDLGTKTGTTGPSGNSSLTVVLDAGPPRDSFFINLRAGMGVFAGGLQTGTFPISGAELSSSTCGLCVNIIADIVAMQGPSKFYFATGGSVTLTSHTPPAGTVSNVTFHEVTSSGMPVSGGCTGSIDALAFSGT